MGLVEGRLFYKAQNPIAFGFDIAITSLWRIGLNAEGDELALLRKLNRLEYRLLKSSLICDQMVCGQDQHDGI